MAGTEGGAAVRNLMLMVQYDGTDYAGFQIQPQAMTVQEELQTALAAVLGHRVKLRAASRTDSGVHALGQIVTFETSNPIPVRNVAGALNERLPLAVNVVEACQVALHFDPRRDARRKLYSYRILNRDSGSPFIARYAWHIAEPLDVETMAAAADLLLGRHDFRAFCAAGGAAENTVRELYRFEVQCAGDMIEMYIEGDGFLYKMVRNMVGTLVEVGLGQRPAEAVGELLANRDRSQAGPTAPGCGLCLVRVSYE